MKDVFQAVTATPVSEVLITRGNKVKMVLDVPDRISNELIRVSVQKSACMDPLFVSCAATIVSNHSSSSLRNVTIFRQLPAEVQTIQNTTRSRRLNDPWSDILSPPLQDSDNEEEVSNFLQYSSHSRRQLAVSGAFNATAISLLLAAVSADLMNSTDDLNVSVSLCAECGVSQSFSADVSIVVQASPAQVDVVLAIARPDAVAAAMIDRLGGCIECGEIGASQPPSLPPLTPPSPPFPPPVGLNGAR